MQSDMVYIKTKLSATNQLCASHFEMYLPIFINISSDNCLKIFTNVSKFGINHNSFIVLTESRMLYFTVFLFSLR